MSDIAILVCSEWQYCGFLTVHGGCQCTVTSVSGNSSTELAELVLPRARPSEQPSQTSHYAVRRGKPPPAPAHHTTLSTYTR